MATQIRRSMETLPFVSLLPLFKRPQRYDAAAAEATKHNRKLAKSFEDLASGPKTSILKLLEEMQTTHWQADADEIEDALNQLLRDLRSGGVVI